MQLVTALRDTLANAIDTDIGATGRVRFYTSGGSVKVATMACSNPAFGTSSSGQISLSGTPLSDSSPLAGTVARLGLYQNATAAYGSWRVLMGVSAATSADVQMPNLVVATTDTVQLTSLSITVPAGSPTT